MLSASKNIVLQFSRHYRRHSDFILLLILFITFRILALAAFRPGGLVLDFSDFYWYRYFAEMIRQGYYPYDNLWTTYPPLFPVVMIAIYQISEMIPPWDFANLWFTLLLGGFFLLFEAGNFILLYLFALKLYPSESAKQLRPCWIYATLFVPVYTLTGWFESYPLFFFLLGLYLLLQNRPYLSAFFTGIGFMIKLIPIVLIPVTIQLISKIKYRLSFSPLRLERYHPSDDSSNQSVIIPYDIPKIAPYLAVFVITVLIIAAPFYWMNPSLIFGSIQISSMRQPWETIWALIDGNYEYGIIPLDMRNLAWQPSDSAVPTRIPWWLVTTVFGLVYGLFYTRPLDWRKPVNMLTFSGFTIALFMLWSKGYSPQWLGWVLFFVALLLPNLRGVVYASILNITNIIEANFYFIIFTDEHWLLAATILIRTFIFLVITAEFLLLIWPGVVTPKLRKARSWGLALILLFLLAASIPGGLKLSGSYFEMRLQQSPYKAVITRLQGEQLKGSLLLNNQTVYDWFYPYLRRGYNLSMLDDYDSPPGSVETRTNALLDNITVKTDILWVYDADASTTTPAEAVLTLWLAGRSPSHIQDIDGGRLYLFILK